MGDELASRRVAPQKPVGKAVEHLRCVPDLALQLLVGNVRHNRDVRASGLERILFGHVPQGAPVPCVAQDAGKRVVESIIDEVKKFFSRSSKAEEEIRVAW